MNITKQNYRVFTPAELATGVGDGTFEIVETGISALIEISKYIADAVHSGTRIKRIRSLEEYRDEDVKVKTAIADKLSALENRIFALEQKP